MSVDFLADAATVSEPDAMRQELIMEYVDALFRGWQRVSPRPCCAVRPCCGTMDWLWYRAEYYPPKINQIPKR